MKGAKFEDLLAIVDFLYFGEANVCQEDLDSFLTIAEEIKLMGLTGQNSSYVSEEQDKPGHSEPAIMDKGLLAPQVL